MKVKGYEIAPYANLDSADLEGANLRYTDLHGANLIGADLRNANLEGADLLYADLRCADLRCADLCSTNLRGANLHSANLIGADLRSANLEGADLHGANLHGTNLHGATLPDFQIPQGVELKVYKKLESGTVCTLLIPKEAERTASLVGNKCRAEYAIVLEGEGVSIHDRNFTYKVGETVRPDNYDDDIREECKQGIHFFMRKEEAIAYNA